MSIFGLFGFKHQPITQMTTTYNDIGAAEFALLVKWYIRE